MGERPREEELLEAARALVTRLEALEYALPEDATLDALAGYVDARAPIARALTLVALEELPRSERAVLAERIERLLARDRAWVAALREQSDAIGARLGEARQATSAARAYRPAGHEQLLRKTA